MIELKDDAGDTLSIELGGHRYITLDGSGVDTFSFTVNGARRLARVLNALADVQDAKIGR